MIVLLHRKKAARRANMIMSKALYQSGALVMAAAGNWQESGIGGGRSKRVAGQKGRIAYAPTGFHARMAKCGVGAACFSRVSISPFLHPAERPAPAEFGHNVPIPQVRQSQSAQSHSGSSRLPWTMRRLLLRRRSRFINRPNAGIKSRKGVPIEAGTKRISAVPEQANDHSPFP